MGDEHRIEQLLNDILQRVTRIETFSSTHHDRIKSLEESQRWLWRTALGAFIAAIVGYFMKG